MDGLCHGFQLLELGAFPLCQRLMIERLANVPVQHLELDEVWTSVGCHQHSQIVKLFSHHVVAGRERYSPARFVSVAKGRNRRPDSQVPEARVHRVERRLEDSLLSSERRLARLVGRPYDEADWRLVPDGRNNPSRWKCARMTS
jgi:hypothetical protein